MTTVTLVYIFRGDEVLLAMKKRGHGAGKWNGPGGKLQGSETPEQAAIREVREELGITPEALEKIGIILYKSPDGDLQTYVFRTDRFYGQPAESEEMKPQWFKVKDMPFRLMWSGDDKWVPLVVEGIKFEATMWYDEKQNNIKAEIRKL